MAGGYEKPRRGISLEDFIRERVAYDPETGHFTWLVTQRHSRPAGSRAGYRSVKGYRYIGAKLEGKTREMPEHRAAFLLMTGEIVADPIDHINGIRDDNRWRNLRRVTVKENTANIGIKVVERQCVRINGRFYPLIGQGFNRADDACREAARLSVL